MIAVMVRTNMARSTADLAGVDSGAKMLVIVVAETAASLAAAVTIDQNTKATSRPALEAIKCGMRRMRATQRNDQAMAVAGSCARSCRAQVSQRSPTHCSRTRTR